MQLLDQQFFQKDEFLKLFSYYHSGKHVFSDLEHHELQLLISISQLVEMLQQTSQQSKLKTSQTNNFLVWLTWCIIGQKYMKHFLNMKILYMYHNCYLTCSFKYTGIKTTENRPWLIIGTTLTGLNVKWSHDGSIWTTQGHYWVLSSHIL